MTTIFYPLRHIRWHTVLCVLLAVLASLYLAAAHAAPAGCMPSGKQMIQTGTTVSEPIACGGCPDTDMTEERQDSAPLTSHCSDCPLCTLHGTAPACAQPARFVSLPQAPPDFAQQHYRSFIPAAPQRPPALSGISQACPASGTAA